MIKTQAIAKFNPNETLTIWDVRDADSYQAGHIAHAINVPIEHINAQTLAQSTGDSTFFVAVAQRQGVRVSC